MRILQVNTSDAGGGAEAVVTRLHAAYRQAGHEAWLAVKRRRTEAPGVFAIPEGTGHGPWGRLLLDLAARCDRGAGRLKGAGLTAAALRDAARPLATIERWCGVEDFRFPATTRLPDLAPDRPHILQCHNLHGGYFDLKALPALGRALPVVLTLHDGWLASGHCAHSFDCQKWRTGCGACPDLGIYPAVARDATARNWRRKRDIFARVRLHAATPSRWLADRIKDSMLMPGIRELRVIGNGIDPAFFAPGERARARRMLGLAADAAVLLFVANSVRANRWKDYATLRAALGRVAARLEGRRLAAVMVGEEAPAEILACGEVTFVPYRRDPATLAAYYRAADLYVHAARAETFSLTVAEAMASGTPVVATATGAVPELVRPLAHRASAAGVPAVDVGVATGILVAQGADEAMAEAILDLLGDPLLRRRLGEAAAREARSRFRIEDQAGRYLAWFDEIAARHARESSP